jgi:hypothetical protein
VASERNCIEAFTGSGLSLKKTQVSNSFPLSFKGQILYF